MANRKPDVPKVLWVVLAFDESGRYGGEWLWGEVRQTRSDATAATKAYRDGGPWKYKVQRYEVSK